MTSSEGDKPTLSKTTVGNVLELKTQVLKLRHEKELLSKALIERDEILANMFSYIQGLVGK